MIRKAAEKIMGYDSNKEMRLKIEQLEDEERIKLSLLNKAKDEGKNEGLEEGMKEGMKVGKEEGRRDGILETAKNMLSLGIDIDMIEKSTGLSREEILKL